jgi:hypothetical protein
MHRIMSTFMTIAEGMLAGLVCHDGPAHLRRGEVVGQAGRDEAAGAHSDVDEEMVEVQAVTGLVEGPEGADLVDGALRSSSRQGQRYARRLRLNFGRAGRAG